MGEVYINPVLQAVFSTVLESGQNKACWTMKLRPLDTNFALTGFCKFTIRRVVCCQNNLIPNMYLCNTKLRLLDFINLCLSVIQDICVLFCGADILLLLQCSLNVQRVTGWGARVGDEH